MQRFGGLVVVSALAGAVIVGAGCDGGSSGSAGDAGTGSDGGPDAATDGGVEPVAWPRDLPSTDAFAPRRGLRVARAVIHLHSPLSHDACDAEGWVDGALADPVCLAHLRAAACTLREDLLMLTDHSPHVNEVSFEQALWIDPSQGDELVMQAGELVGARWGCPDGHAVLVTVGSENDLMPVSLRRPPVDSTDPVVLGNAYDDDGPGAVQTFHDAGAVVLVAHTESKALDYLRTLGADGVEIYNTHANVDFDIRADWLGLEPGGYLPSLLQFVNPALGLAPDLAFLAFFSEATPDLDKWDTLLSEGTHLTGTAGCDAHENSIPSILPDGERGDSYRRMMRWFSNYLLVTDVTVDATDEAVRNGRLFVGFDAFGTPEGFDFVAEDGATTVEMGATAAVGATLRVTRPHLPAGFPAAPAPTIRMRILKAADGGAVEVANGGGETLEHVATEAGAYRAEVRIVPEHARPFLGAQADDLIHEVPWVYANPIYVE